MMLMMMMIIIITQLSNEICPKVKLDCISVFLRWLHIWNPFCHINETYRGTLTFRLASACGRQVYRRGQADNPKKNRIHPSVLWHTRGFREEKTAYCTENIVVYPNIPAALRPVKHDDSLPYPKPLQQWSLHEESTNTSPEDEPGPSYSNVDPDFPQLTVLHLISQSEPNDLVTVFNLSKIHVELLFSRLKGWNFMVCNVSYRKRQQSMS